MDPVRSRFVTGWEMSITAEVEQLILPSTWMTWVSGPMNGYRDIPIIKRVVDVLAMAIVLHPGLGWDDEERVCFTPPDLGKLR